MTDEQFDLITGLLRMTSEPILAAARMVLVHGEQQNRAAAETGCDRTALVKAVGKIRAAHEKIVTVYGESLDSGI